LISSIEHIIPYIKIALVLSILSYATILDIKYRETPLKPWIISILIASILTTVEYSMKPSLTLQVIALILFSIVISTAIPWIIYIIGLIGGADALAYTLITVSAPIRPYPAMENIIPFPFLVLIYSNIVPVIIALIMLIYNLSFNKKYIPKGISLKTKIPLLINGIPVKINTYLKIKFAYPLQIFEKNHKLKIRYRSTFDIEEDPEIHKKRIRELINEGVITQEDKIWISYGLPFVLFILIGYITALIISDSFIIMILLRILR